MVMQLFVSNPAVTTLSSLKQGGGRKYSSTEKAPKYFSQQHMETIVIRCEPKKQHSISTGRIQKKRDLHGA